MGPPGPCIHEGALIAFGIQCILGIWVVIFAVASVLVVRVICLGAGEFQGFFRSHVGMWIGVCEMT